jgi:hypothetical protein
MSNVWRPVTNKQDFVKRYKAGEFGNGAPTWDTASDCLLSGYCDDVHIRNRVTGAKTWYSLPIERLEEVWEEAVLAYGAANLYVSGMCPHDKTLLQGEVMQSEQGLYLYGTRVPKPMREALAIEAFEKSGTIANCLLRSTLCPNSYEWLQVLLDRYPFHVVEFTALSCEWGTCSGFNTCYWEVRTY